MNAISCVDEFSTHRQRRKFLDIDLNVMIDVQVHGYLIFPYTDDDFRTYDENETEASSSPQPCDEGQSGYCLSGPHVHEQTEGTFSL